MNEKTSQNEFKKSTSAYDDQSDHSYFGKKDYEIDEDLVELEFRDRLEAFGDLTEEKDWHI